MENKNAVSCEDLINFMKEKTKSAVTIKSCGQDINVMPVLSLEQFNMFVGHSVEMMYDDNNNFDPAMRDLAIRINTVFRYTNVTLPEDLEDYMEDIYELLYKTSFYDDVCKVIDKNQYTALINAINESVDYRNANAIDKVNNQIAILSNDIQALGEQFANVIGDVSNEDVQKLLNAIENNTIDEGKLIKEFTKTKGV